jgi:hypothetical protein
MSTCTNCGRSLQTGHRCRGVWRLRLAVYARVLGGGAIAACAGALVVLAVYGAVSLAAILLAGAAGAIVVWSFLRGEPTV